MTADDLRRELAEAGSALARCDDLDARLGREVAGRRGDVHAELARLRPSALTSEGDAERYMALIEERGALDRA